MVSRIQQSLLLVGLFLAGVLGVVAADELAEHRPDTTHVTITSPDGALRGTLTVDIADSARERYTGLSNTESLGPNEGLLFVHPRESTYAYVMRDMAFPIDIVFIDADKQITSIHHAPVEKPPLDRYRGQGKWVLEVNYQWTTEHNVSVGDHVQFTIE